MMFERCTSLLLLFGHLGVASAYDNGVGRTPPMGWNSWNHFHGGVSADILKQTADAFVSLGLKDAGYTFINTVCDLEFVICDFDLFAAVLIPHAQYFRHRRIIY